MSFQINIFNNSTETFFIVSTPNIFSIVSGPISFISGSKYALPPGKSTISHGASTFAIMVLDSSNLCLGQYSISRQTIIEGTTIPNFNPVNCSLPPNKNYSFISDYNNALYVCPINSIICNDQCCLGSCHMPAFVKQQKCCPYKNSKLDPSGNCTCPLGSSVVNGECACPSGEHFVKGSQGLYCCPIGSVDCASHCCSETCQHDIGSIGLALCCPAELIACNGSCCNGVCILSATGGVCCPKDSTHICDTTFNTCC